MRDEQSRASLSRIKHFGVRIARLSDFELRNFHVALTRRDNRKCIRLPYAVSPLLRPTSIALRSHFDPCANTRNAHTRPNIISSMTSNPHRQKDIAIVEGRIVSAVSKHLLFRVALSHKCGTLFSVVYRDRGQRSGLVNSLFSILPRACT